MIAIVDYGMGNLRSVAKAVERVGGQATIVTSPRQVLEADKVILPGVGAFGDAMENLQRQDLVGALRQVIQEDRPFLGICLGLQLLFTTGYEDGEYPGLNVFPGKVVRFDFASLGPSCDLAIPHMGWNSIRWTRDCPFLAGLEQDSYVYFVHSYYPVPEQPGLEATSTEYGYPFTSSVWRGNLFASQFHPEKSQQVGLKIVENFVRLSP
jgi:imidazole glycerol-phosphate synthase subunit HisH